MDRRGTPLAPPPPPGCALAPGPTYTPVAAGESVYASPTDPLLSLNEYCGADFDPSQFFGAFWTPSAPSLDDGFEELRKYLRQGNDFCRDIVDLFRERWIEEDMGWLDVWKLPILEI